MKNIVRFFTFILPCLISASVLALSVSFSASAADDAAAKPVAELPPIAETYIKAWVDFDGNAVNATLASTGKYVDLFNKRGIRDEKLVDYVHSRKGSKLTTTSRTLSGDGKATYGWSFYDANGNLVVSGITTLILVDGKIAEANGAW